jgi:hypothetical protein
VDPTADVRDVDWIIREWEISSFWGNKFFTFKKIKGFFKMELTKRELFAKKNRMEKIKIYFFKVTN